MRPESAATPERALCCALLHESIELATGMRPAKEGEVYEAQQWLKAADDAWILPCVSVCHIAGIDHEAMLSRVAPRFIAAAPWKAKTTGRRRLKNAPLPVLISDAPKKRPPHLGYAQGSFKCSACPYRAMTKRGLFQHSTHAHAPTTLDLPYSVDISFRLRAPNKGFCGADGLGRVFTVMSDGNVRDDLGNMVATYFEKIVEEAEEERIVFVAMYSDEPTEASRSTRKRYLRKLRGYFTTDSVRSAVAADFRQIDIVGL